MTDQNVKLKSSSVPKILEQAEIEAQRIDTFSTGTDKTVPQAAPENGSTYNPEDTRLSGWRTLSGGNVKSVAVPTIETNFDMGEMVEVAETFDSMVTNGEAPPYNAYFRTPFEALRLKMESGSSLLKEKEAELKKLLPAFQPLSKLLETSGGDYNWISKYLTNTIHTVTKLRVHNENELKTEKDPGVLQLRAKHQKRLERLEKKYKDEFKKLNKLIELTS